MRTARSPRSFQLPPGPCRLRPPAASGAPPRLEPEPQWSVGLPAGGAGHQVSTSGVRPQGSRQAGCCPGRVRGVRWTAGRPGTDAAGGPRARDPGAGRPRGRPLLGGATPAACGPGARERNFPTAACGRGRAARGSARGRGRARRRPRAHGRIADAGERGGRGAPGTRPRAPGRRGSSAFRGVWLLSLPVPQNPHRRRGSRRVRARSGAGAGTVGR